MFDFSQGRIFGLFVCDEPVYICLIKASHKYEFRKHSLVVVVEKSEPI